MTTEKSTPSTSHPPQTRLTADEAQSAINAGDQTVTALRERAELAERRLAELEQSAGQLPTPQALASWVYIAIGCSEAESIAQGVPKFFRDGVIGGLVQAFDSFIAGTADDDDDEVTATHDAAVRLRKLFAGDIGELDVANGGA